jgi:hypothetical protein
MSRFPQTVNGKILHLSSRRSIYQNTTPQFNYNKHCKASHLHPSDIQVPLFKKYSCGISEFRSFTLQFADYSTACAVSTKIIVLRVLWAQRFRTRLWSWRESVSSQYAATISCISDCAMASTLKSPWLLFAAITFYDFVLVNSGLCTVSWTRETISQIVVPVTGVENCVCSSELLLVSVIK